MNYDSDIQLRKSFGIWRYRFRMGPDQDWGFEFAGGLTKAGTVRVARRHLLECAFPVLKPEKTNPKKEWHSP